LEEIHFKNTAGNPREAGRVGTSHALSVVHTEEIEFLLVVIRADRLLFEKFAAHTCPRK
jgi:hypothetical protein